MRLIVFGASGKTGREIVTQALERGHQVTAFVRRPKNSAYLTNDCRLHAATSWTLRLLMRRCRPRRRSHRTRTSSLSRSVQHSFARNTEYVDAMKKHGVRRIVCETALGVGDSTGRLGVYYTLFVIPFISSLLLV
jgi:nucleoside-diphosphate-sugar epimerase